MAYGRRKNIKRAAKQEGPVSVRLTSEVREDLADYAAHTGRSFSGALKDLVELGLRMRRFPGIIFVDGPAGRRAHLAGTGLDVWEVIEILRDYPSAEVVLDHFPNLSPRSLQVAQAYAEAYSAEIKEFSKANAEPPESLKRKFPLLQIVDVDV